MQANVSVHAGKGVVVAQKLEEALEAVDDILLSRKFGDAGDALLLCEISLSFALSVWLCPTLHSQTLSDLQRFAKRSL